MAVDGFQVGDVVRLTGEGWEHYCSTRVAGREFEVWEVTEKGEAVIPLVPAGGGAFYMAEVSPVAGDELYGAVVNRRNQVR